MFHLLKLLYGTNKPYENLLVPSHACRASRSPFLRMGGDKLNKDTRPKEKLAPPFRQPRADAIAKFSTSKDSISLRLSNAL